MAPDSGTGQGAPLGIRDELPVLVVAGGEGRRAAVVGDTELTSGSVHLH
ncbi:hypothetical protein ACFQLX_01165 [Streptomyces polyrhachis]|uniref:NTP transferase domain-containing protein n=1 Tax=Streptomyces polyrhachis TaxID=1282885 RepID=A0ABW2G7S7_9ACTN